MSHTTEGTFERIINVRLREGASLSGPKAVELRDGRIHAVRDWDGASDGPALGDIDGSGAFLLPGLIDAHVHVISPADLKAAEAAGITTVLDMGSMPHVLSTLEGPRRTDVLSAGVPASAPGSVQTTVMGFPATSAIARPEAADSFVRERIAAGSSWIKIICEDPRSPVALALPTIVALVEAAHAANLKVVAHAVTVAAYGLAVRAGVDVLTHAPLDGGPDAAIIDTMHQRGIAVIPTLVMLEAMAPLARRHNTAARYENADAWVRALAAAEVPLLAGTDANTAASSPARIPHGRGLHRELLLLQRAGLSVADSLRAATSLPAAVFSLRDRGALEPGLRADLILVDEDPIVDPSRLDHPRRVWIGSAAIEAVR